MAGETGAMWEPALSDSTTSLMRSGRPACLQWNKQEPFVPLYGMKLWCATSKPQHEKRHYYQLCLLHAVGCLQIWRHSSWGLCLTRSPLPLFSFHSGHSLRSHSAEKMPWGPLRWRLHQGSRGTGSRGRRRHCPAGRARTGWMRQVTVLSSMCLVYGFQKCCWEASRLSCGCSALPTISLSGVCPFGTAGPPSHEVSHTAHNI